MQIVPLVLVSLCMGTIGQVMLKLGAHAPVHGPTDLAGNLLRPMTLGEIGLVLFTASFAGGSWVG